MKNIIPLISFLCSGMLLTNCSTSTTPTKESYSGIISEVRAPKSISYAGETYYAGYSAISKNGALVEYFRKGQGPKTWSKLIAVRTTNPPSTPKAEVMKLAKIVHSSGGGSGVFGNNTTGEYGIDFMLPKSGDLEFNVFRYAPQTGSGGTKSIQYAEVISKSKFEKMNLKSVRQIHIERVLTMKFPEIN